MFSKFVKILLAFVILQAILFVLFLPLSSFMLMPRFHFFTDYRPLNNWDLSNHARGDFDRDGKDDLITFTGCAFLSAVDLEQIPSATRCTARGISFQFDQDKSLIIGQKFIQTEVFDLNLSTQNRAETGRSFLGKSRDGVWSIYADSASGLRRFDILPTGLLSQNDQITLADQLDLFMYGLSNTLLILTLPAFFVLMIISYISLLNVGFFSMMASLLFLIFGVYALWVVWARNMMLKHVSNTTSSPAILTPSQIKMFLIVASSLLIVCLITIYFFVVSQLLASEDAINRKTITSQQAEIEKHHQKYQTLFTEIFSQAASCNQKNTLNVEPSKLMIDSCYFATRKRIDDELGGVLASIGGRLPIFFVRLANGDQLEKLYQDGTFQSKPATTKGERMVKEMLEGTRDPFVYPQYNCCGGYDLIPKLPLVGLLYPGRVYLGDFQTEIELIHLVRDEKNIILGAVV